MDTIKKKMASLKEEKETALEKVADTLAAMKALEAEGVAVSSYNKSHGIIGWNY